MDIVQPTGLRPLTWRTELAIILEALVAIGSVPMLPMLLIYLFWKACCSKPEERWQRWRRFTAMLAVYLFLMFIPTSPRPWLMGSAFFRWWLEYFSVKLVYQDGQPLPPRQYIYLFMPHGLYPFSGACASIASMRDIFPRMRIAAASVSFRIPVIRQLIGWINTIPVDSGSIRKALKAGDSVGLFPGGVAEMVRTDGNQEKLLLRSRKGFVRLAMEHGVPIVPVYVFGQSVLWSQLPLPRIMERLSRWLQASIILPYGRFGLLVPQKKSLLYAIGAPIQPGDNMNTTHDAVITAVQTLYDTYKGRYGWEKRILQID